MIIKVCIESINFVCFLTITKKIYLKTNIAGYHIFIYILVNHIKIISANYRQLILILLKSEQLFVHSFSQTIKNHFFSFNNINVRLLSKMESNKEKTQKLSG